MKRHNKCILVISDAHFPYHHPDTIAFLKEIKKVYKPDRIVNIGDEIDGHAISFHDHDPDLASPGHEFELAIQKLQPLYKLFPKMDLVQSNHGDLVYRKGKASGLPKHVFKSYRDILCAPKGWHWHRYLVIKPSEGGAIYFCHNKTKNVMQNSQAMGMSFVQGHFHEDFQIRYWGNSEGLYWGMTVGCLIDDEALAYAYNKTNLKRPIIGVGMIINGQPKLIPMILGKNGRWVKKLT